MVIASLASMLGEPLLQYFSNINTFKQIVIYDVKIKNNNSEKDHSHEEADTLILHQGLASIGDSD